LILRRSDASTDDRETHENAYSAPDAWPNPAADAQAYADADAPTVWSRV